MSIEQFTHSIPNRSESLSYDQIGPGLYPDETVYIINGEHVVATSIRSDRNRMNNGLVFTAWARAINPDGSTIVDTAGAELEIEYRHSLNSPVVSPELREKTAREILLMILGQPAPVYPEGEFPALSVPEAAAQSLSIISAINAAFLNSGEIDVATVI